MEHEGLILLTGGTGYIGGRLIRPLEATGRPLRLMVRDPERLRPSNPPASFVPRVADTTELVKGDVFDPASLARALTGADTAYYLVHSLGTSTGDFYEQELTSARNFAKAARDAGVRRVIYLGGLGRSEDKLSPHLASRQDVGRVLCESGAETIEFRASVVLGSGSISFEMIRALVDRLPVLVTPRWVDSLAQPIAVEDVVAFLVAALDVPVRERCTVYEIGGADRVSYGGMMQAYARSQGVQRPTIKLPWLTPRLSSGWLTLVTPLYFRVGRHLLEGVRNETVVTNDAAARDFPQIRPMGIDEAIARALRYEDGEYAATRWSDARSVSPPLKHWPAERFGRRYMDQRTVDVLCPPSQAFGAILCIGGEKGWYAWTWLWTLRGLLDQLVGGVGSRRGRRDPTCVIPGDTVDFWRVEALEPDRLLRLAAEMRMPGRGWLQFELTPLSDGQTRIVQTALYDPVGLYGQLYWFSLWPLHEVIFRAMIRGIAEESGCLEPAVRRRRARTHLRSRPVSPGMPPMLTIGALAKRLAKNLAPAL
jgi:uncharacterized protein YbjT (DUF2867 family)